MMRSLSSMGTAALLILAAACGPNLNTASPMAAYRLQRELLTRGDSGSYAGLWSARWKKKSWPRIAARMRTWPAAKLRIYGIDSTRIKQLSDADMLRAFFSNPRLKGALPSPKAKLTERIHRGVGIIEARLKHSVCTQIFLKEGGVWRIATMPYCPPPMPTRGTEVAKELDVEASSPLAKKIRKKDHRTARPPPPPRRRSRPITYDGPAERELVGGAWCDLQDEVVASSLRCRRTGK